MSLYDAQGRKIQRPITRQIVQPSYRDRWSTHPSEGLTPTRLSSLLRMAEAGDLTSQAELFEEMEEKDGHLFSCLQTRKLAVVNKEFEVLPSSDKRQDKKIAELVRENLENLQDLEDDLLDLLDAIGKGYSVSEIMWDVSESQVWIGNLKWVHPKRFTMGDDNRLKLLQSKMFEGDELEPNKFVVHTYRGRSGLPSKGGLLRTCAWMYLFKNYDIKDWVAFTELYGIPLRVGKYAPGTSDDDIAVLEDAVKNLGSDGAAIIPDSTIIEFKEAIKTSSLNVFKDLAEFCDKTVAKAILGQTETVESTPGRLGAAKEKSDVRQDLVEADCKSLQKCVRWQLVKPLVDFNFGRQQRYPLFKIKYEPPEDLQMLARRDRTLVSIGLRVPESYFYKTYGIPEPAEDEPVVTPPSAMGGLGGALKDTGPEGIFDRLQRVPGQSSGTLKKKSLFEMKDLDPQVRKNLRPVVKLENQSIREAVDVYDELLDALRVEFSSLASLPQLRGHLEKRALDTGWIRKAAPQFEKAISAADGIGRDQVREELNRALDKYGVSMSDRNVCRIEYRLADVPVGVDWALTPEEASQWFRLQSFTIAHVQNQELLDFVGTKVQAAIDEGMTYAQWLDSIDEMFDACGVTRRSNHHLQTTFQTNIQSAYNSGRWAEYHDPDVAGFFPYFQYHAVDDDRTRYEHLAMNNAVYHRDDPIWATWWPPNGFNCRCTVTAISRYEAEEYGIQPGQYWGVDENGDMIRRGGAPTGKEYLPDEGFNSNPADGEYFKRWAREKGVDLEEIKEMYL